jgi:hypothetical protein
VLACMTDGYDVYYGARSIKHEVLDVKYFIVTP